MYRFPEESTATPIGLVQQRRGGRAAVARVAGRTGGAAGHGVDVTGGHGDAELGVAVGGDLLDPVVAGVGDEDVAVRVGGDRAGIVQPGRHGRAAVARRSSSVYPLPGQVGDGSRSIVLTLRISLLLVSET